MIKIFIMAFINVFIWFIEISIVGWKGTTWLQFHGITIFLIPVIYICFFYKIFKLDTGVKILRIVFSYIIFLSTYYVFLHNIYFNNIFPNISTVIITLTSFYFLSGKILEIILYPGESKSSLLFIYSIFITPISILFSFLISTFVGENTIYNLSVFLEYLFSPVECIKYGGLLFSLSLFFGLISFRKTNSQVTFDGHLHH